MAGADEHAPALWACRAAAVLETAGMLLLTHEAAGTKRARALGLLLPLLLPLRANSSHMLLLWLLLLLLLVVWLVGVLLKRVVVGVLLILLLLLVAWWLLQLWLLLLC